MKICPICASFNDDTAKFCSKCGFKLEEEKQEQPTPVAPVNSKTQKISSLAVGSFVISIFSLLLFATYFPLLLGTLAIIFGIIGFFQSKSKNSRIYALFGIAISIMSIVILFEVGVDLMNSKDEKKKEEVQAEQEYIEPSPTAKPTPEPAEAPISYKHAFVYDLILNPSPYLNKYVETSFPVGSCSSYDDGTVKMYTEYTDYDLCGESENLIIYLPNGSTVYEDGKYVTVQGKLTYDEYQYILTDAKVVNIGSESEQDYQDGMVVYKYNRGMQLQAEKENFIESCEDVSYDDLLRYPETYDGKPIKLTIYASDVKADGWVFKGDILAEYEGKELIVFDDREVREPRLVTGDKVTVYATGAGLGKMQIKEEGLIFNKTVDDYNIPQISIKYTEWDKAFTDYDSSDIKSKEGDLYDEGKRAGDDLSETLADIDWDENKENARELGKEAAEFVNELIGAE